MKFKDIIVAFIFFSTIIGGSVFLKNWQCAEMYPDASRVAYVLWK
jgi:hypothetical protein